MKTKLSPALQHEAMLRGETPRQRTSEKIIALKSRIKRLEEAGDYLCAAAAFMGWHDKIEAWNKAKEDKL